MGLLERGNINILGRILFGVSLSYMGYQMLVDGAEFYSPFLHAWRRVIAPDMKNRINENLTFEDINAYVTQFIGSCLILGGLLCSLNQKAGAFLVILAMMFMMATQDNPWIKELIKPKPKNMKIRWNDITRHLAVIGACLYMCVTEPFPTPEEEKPEKKKKKN